MTLPKNVRNHGPSRRRVLTGGTALAFALGAAGIVKVVPSWASASPSTDDLAPSGWVRISADGTVTILFPATEMGQGSSTALPTILAEELDADWDTVEIEQLDTDAREFGNRIFGGFLYTAGSTAVYGYWDALRRAGAQARLMLTTMAADHWGVSPAQLTTEPGRVVDPQGERSIAFGDLVALGLTPPEVPDIGDDDLKKPEDFRLIGHDVPRHDVPAKSRGEARYVIDVVVPEMLYAAVERAPVEGETPATIDDAQTRATPGVVAVVTLPDGVAVVADRYETALKGRAALQVEWTDQSPARSHDSEATLAAYRDAAADAAHEAAVWSEQGNADAALASADRIVEADYLSDYAYHAQIEPMATVASVDEDGKGAEVWVGSQTQSLTTLTVTEVLGTTPERVRLHMMTMGGSFGRRTALMQEYVRDALLTSKATGRPVKVVWTREDDLKHGAFRPAAAQRMTAGLSADGQLMGYRHRVATPSVIAFFNPMRWQTVKPNDIISMRGSESKFYTLPDMRAEHVITERAARLAPWRAIGASYTSFAAEAFMDELAEAAGKDPIVFRMALLADNPRGQTLLQRVADMADWGAVRNGTALGVSFAGYGDSMAAGVAEVALDEESGRISVPRFWTAVDAGTVVAPDNARNQIEGGIIYGLSSALKEQVKIKNGEVVQSNFNDYPILRANEVPEIDIHIAQNDLPPTGIGEVGTPMTSAAVANAFFALTGRRLRHLPFTPERVRDALA